MRVCVCVSIVTIYLKNYYIYNLESLKKNIEKFENNNKEQI